MDLRKMDYELGDLSDREILQLYTELIKAGTLPDAYKPIATSLIEDGILDANGELTDYGSNELEKFECGT